MCWNEEQLPQSLVGQMRAARARPALCWMPKSTTKDCLHTAWINGDRVPPKLSTGNQRGTEEKDHIASKWNKQFLHDVFAWVGYKELFLSMASSRVATCNYRQSSAAHSTATGYPQVEILKGASSSQGNCLLTCSLQNTIQITLAPLRPEAYADLDLMKVWPGEQSHTGHCHSPTDFRGTSMHQSEHIWVRMSSIMDFHLSTAGHFVQLEGKRRQAEEDFMQLESHRLLGKSRGGSASGSDWAFYSG